MKTFSINKPLTDKTLIKTEKLLSYKIKMKEHSALKKDEDKDKWLYEAFIGLYKHPQNTIKMNFDAYVNKKRQIEDLRKNTSKTLALITQDEFEAGASGVMEDLIQDHTFDEPEKHVYRLETVREIREFFDRVYREKGISLDRLLYLITVKQDKYAEYRLNQLIEYYNKEEEIREIYDLVSDIYENF